MKCIIPTQHIGNITITLKNFNKETKYTFFEIEFYAFTKTSIVLTGDTIDLIKAMTDGIKKEVFNE